MQARDLECHPDMMGLIHLNWIGKSRALILLSVRLLSQCHWVAYCVVFSLLHKTITQTCVFFFMWIKLQISYSLYQIDENYSFVSVFYIVGILATYFLEYWDSKNSFPLILWHENIRALNCGLMFDAFQPFSFNWNGWTMSLITKCTGLIFEREKNKRLRARTWD